MITKRQFLERIYDPSCTVNAGRDQQEIPEYLDEQLLSVLSPRGNSMIIGGLRAGRTRAVAGPMLLKNAYDGTSMIVHDADGELLHETYALLKREGYSIHVLNLKSPGSGSRWNPLYFGAQMYSASRIDLAVEYFREIGRVFQQCGDDNHSVDSEISMADFFAGLCLVACHELKPEEVTLSIVYEIFRERCMDISGKEDMFIYLRDKGDWILDQLLISEYQNTNNLKWVLDGIFSKAMRPFIGNQQIQNALSVSDFSWNDFSGKKAALFVITDSENYFTEGIFSLLVNGLYAEACLQGRSPRNNVRFVLDDFCDFPALHDLYGKLRNSEKYGVRWSIFVPSVDRMKLVYGNDSILGALENIEDIAVLNCVGADTLDFINSRMRMTIPDASQIGYFDFDRKGDVCQGVFTPFAIHRLGESFPITLYDISIFQSLMNTKRTEEVDLKSYPEAVHTSFSLKDKAAEIRKHEEEIMREAIGEDPDEDIDSVFR